MSDEREAMNDRIREIFIANGFTIKEGQTDLKPYVYEAAYALLRATQFHAGANETTLRVLSSHAIRKHEGVTIFGDPAQVLKVMAAIESAGATGQKSVGNWLWSELMNYCRERGIAPANSDRLFEIVKRARDEFDAAPIGDNGASGYVQYSDELTPRTLGEKAAFLEGIEEGRMRAVRDAQPAESTRVELTDEEIDAVWDSVSWKDLNVSSLEHVSILRRRFARALLARASAKGA